MLHSVGIRRPDLLVGPDWSAAPGTVTDYSSQLSGVFLEEAAAVADLPMVYRDVSYRGAWSSLPAGSYTLAQFNFTGATTTQTASASCLAGLGFNDTVSSLRVAPRRNTATGSRDWTCAGSVLAASSSMTCGRAK